jgi:hypothetical protein
MWLPASTTIIHFDSESGLNVAALDENRAYLSTGAAMNSSTHSMAGAQRVRELTPGALAVADAMLAWAPAPWCPNVF